ncbi:MAG: S9 family peptidase [Myxococcota bacterium]
MRFLVVFSLLVGCSGRSATTTPNESQRMRPPMAKQVPHTLRAHGQTREDPYYWMRDDEREDPEILAHLRAEDEYAEAMLEPLRDLRTSLFDEIVARIPQDDESVPAREHGYWYYTRFEEGREHPIYCRKADGPDWESGAETIVLDVNIEAERHDYYAAGGLSVTADGSTLAYGEDTLSRRIYTLRFRNLETGELYDDRIEGTTGSSVWAQDGRTVFYVKREEGTLRAHQVWRHVLGSSEADVLVFDETDAEFSVGVGLSRSEEWVLIASRQTTQSEVRVVDAAMPNAEPRVLLPREENHEYQADHADGRFYFRTNWQARDFRLMSATLDDASDKERWRVEIPARDDVHLRGFELFEGFVVATERAEGLARVRVLPKEGEPYVIDFDESVYTAGLGYNSEYGTTTLRLSYSSMVTPASVYDYDMNTRERALRKRARVGGDFDAARYVTLRTTATARDGTRVPISIVHRADLDRSSPAPLLLYGYGSYGYSIDPTFSSPRLSLIDRGVVFAIAHIRGGQEMGRAWYEDGKLLNKMNTFTDFIDCAEHLIEEGWTERRVLFGQGGSAGGLLIGAVANLRPDLFQGLIAQVPFVDVVTTMLDESIPLTTFEYDEWGNPNERPFYDYMMRYSPYDNVSAQDYPHMLVMTGLHDSQVQYWEPMKWVARLRERGTGEAQLLFTVNMTAGHGGASGRFRRHRDTATAYAFILHHAGRDE